MERAVDNTNNYFDIFGISPNFYIDKKVLDIRYFDLSKKNTVDSSLLNKAYSCLKCNVTRAEYILNDLLKFDYASKHCNILDLFEMNERIESLKINRSHDKLDNIKRNLKSEFRLLSSELTMYDIEIIDSTVAHEIFEKISRCKYIEKMINRINL